MLEHLLNQLIIIAGQWRDNQSSELANQFEEALIMLQELIKGSREQATQTLLTHIEGAIL